MSISFKGLSMESIPSKEVTYTLTPGKTIESVIGSTRAQASENETVLGAKPISERESKSSPVLDRFNIFWSGVSFSGKISLHMLTVKKYVKEIITQPTLEERQEKTLGILGFLRYTEQQTILSLPRHITDGDPSYFLPSESRSELILKILKLIQSDVEIEDASIFKYH